jgi:SNF2-related domain
MRLENLTAGLSLNGLEASAVATIVAVVPIAEGAVQLIYKTPDGTLKDRLLNRADEPNISIATTERPWSFEGDGEAFKLTVEAKRIDLAFLFDPMMAVHTSNVDPLPHQITAVYESMLPRQPLRFVLADDPGAGKTIMAGLYIRELIMRADARRILIVAPGSLVEQWREEMFEKFGLEFRIFTKDLEAATPSGNPFQDIDHLIVRLDQMSRNEDLQEKLCSAGWDLVVFDEAHKLAAHFYGSKLEKTGRFNLAEKLGAQTRHLLLMTATPHNGKEEDFQLFLSLLDSDRFYGKFRDGVHKVDCSDLIRRMKYSGSLRSITAAGRFHLPCECSHSSISRSVQYGISPSYCGGGNCCRRTQLRIVCRVTRTRTRSSTSSNRSRRGSSDFTLASKNEKGSPLVLSSARACTCPFGLGPASFSDPHIGCGTKISLAKNWASRTKIISANRS